MPMATSSGRARMAATAMTVPRPCSRPPTAATSWRAIPRSFGAGGNDAWVLKLDGSGNVVWQKTYGGAGNEVAWSIAPIAGGGYVLAGYTSSFGAAGGDAWVLRLDASGNVVWQRTYGGASEDRAHSVRPTADGGYIVAGTTYSLGGVTRLATEARRRWVRRRMRHRGDVERRRNGQHRPSGERSGDRSDLQHHAGKHPGRPR